MLISALIGDRTYRIKIEPRDEEMVRRTLKTINENEPGQTYLIIRPVRQYSGRSL